MAVATCVRVKNLSSSAVYMVSPCITLRCGSGEQAKNGDQGGRIKDSEHNTTPHRPVVDKKRPPFAGNSPTHGSAKVKQTAMQTQILKPASAFSLASYLMDRVHGWSWMEPVVGVTKW